MELMIKTELGSFRHDLLALRNRHNGGVSHLTDEALRRDGWKRDRKPVESSDPHGTPRRRQS